MLTAPDHPRDESESEQPFNGETAEAEFEAAFKEAPAKTDEVDDDSPLTFDEFLIVGKQALERIKEIPLKPIRRGVRETLDSLFGAVQSASESVERKHIGKKDKGE